MTFVPFLLVSNASVMPLSVSVSPGLLLLLCCCCIQWGLNQHEHVLLWERGEMDRSMCRRFAEMQFWMDVMDLWMCGDW